MFSVKSAGIVRNIHGSDGQCGVVHEYAKTCVFYLPLDFPADLWYTKIRKHTEERSVMTGC